MPTELDEIMADFDPDANFLDPALPRDMCRYFTVSEVNNNRILKSDQFSLINYNICSFNKNGTIFESLLESIDLEFKCVVISETWNNELNMEQCKLPNYKEYHTPRSGEGVCTKSGGISVFWLEKDVKATKNKKLSICTVNIEMCGVELEYSQENM